MPGIAKIYSTTKEPDIIAGIRFPNWVISVKEVLYSICFLYIVKFFKPLALAVCI